MLFNIHYSSIFCFAELFSECRRFVFSDSGYRAGPRGLVCGGGRGALKAKSFNQAAK